MLGVRSEDARGRALARGLRPRRSAAGRRADRAHAQRAPRPRRAAAQAGRRRRAPLTRVGDRHGADATRAARRAASSCSSRTSRFLLRVERMEAWREVARRIAHEIKNPLTPIQLSAQRLRKRYAAELGGRRRRRCSTSARAPSSARSSSSSGWSTSSPPSRACRRVEVAPHDLQRASSRRRWCCSARRHRDIAFDVRRRPPTCRRSTSIRDAIKRAVINLLDNAVHACQGADGGGAHRGGDRARSGAWASCGSRSPTTARGMTPDVQARVFEPYFSTKKDGTGLGLAIVSAIVADHQAYIRVRDNQPRGVRVVIEFPLRRAATALRARGRRERVRRRTDGDRTGRRRRGRDPRLAARRAERRGPARARGRGRAPGARTWCAASVPSWCCSTCGCPRSTASSCCAACRRSRSGRR